MLILKWILIFTTFLLWIKPASAQVDYYDEIQPIFDNSCISCHGPGGQSGVSLVDYDAVMNSVGNQYGENIVQPEEPDESPIVDKIESDNPEYGVRMPQGGPYLDDDEIEAIREWIEEGAKEEAATSSPQQKLVAEGFELKGNFPNPFNPTTQIEFNLPRQADYTISVTSLTGELVHELHGSAGEGTVTESLNMGRYSSGMYIYEVKMISGNGQVARKTGKMMLLK